MNGVGTKPLVSVVIPVYNAEAFLRESLDSVLAQDYDPFEVIVVDDGSTDASGQIAQSYPDVRYLRQENQGASSARNLGIADARGEMIANVDADDVIPPQKLSTQVGFLLDHPDVACVLGRQEWINPPPDLVRDQVWGDLDGIPLNSMVVRKSALLEVGELDEEQGGDMDLLVRMRERGLQFVVLPEIVVHRRYHGDNLVAGRGLSPLPPASLKAKLERERARAATERKQ
jgi:glycosyltransferase involved in cell wall biosynthesis